MDKTYRKIVSIMEKIADPVLFSESDLVLDLENGFVFYNVFSGELYTKIEVAKDNLMSGEIRRATQRKTYFINSLTPREDLTKKEIKDLLTQIESNEKYTNEST